MFGFFSFPLFFLLFKKIQSGRFFLFLLEPPGFFLFQDFGLFGFLLLKFDLHLALVFFLMLLKGVQFLLVSAKDLGLFRFGLLPC